MALVVFLRGVNVGGRRRFRPRVLAKELADHDVVNVGAAEAEIAFCEGRDLLRVEAENPFGTEPVPPDLVRFVSILSRPGRAGSSSGSTAVT